VASVFMAGS